jgi:hypothetical protein
MIVTVELCYWHEVTGISLSTLRSGNKKENLADKRERHIRPKIQTMEQNARKKKENPGIWDHILENKMISCSSNWRDLQIEK